MRKYLFNQEWQKKKKKWNVMHDAVKRAIATIHEKKFEKVWVIINLLDGVEFLDEVSFFCLVLANILGLC